MTRLAVAIPLTGAPSINSNLARVSVSTYVLGPDPVDSRRLISSSIFLILILTKRKYILPRITSFRWYLQETSSNEKRPRVGKKGKYSPYLGSHLIAKPQKKQLIIRKYLLAFVVFKFNVQAIFNPNFHLQSHILCFIPDLQKFKYHRHKLLKYIYITNFVNKNV